MPTVRGPEDSPSDLPLCVTGQREREASRGPGELSADGSGPRAPKGSCSVKGVRSRRRTRPPVNGWLLGARNGREKAVPYEVSSRCFAATNSSWVSAPESRSAARRSSFDTRSSCGSASDGEDDRSTGLTPGAGSPWLSAHREPSQYRVRVRSSGSGYQAAAGAGDEVGEELMEVGEELMTAGALAANG